MYINCQTWLSLQKAFFWHRKRSKMSQKKLADLANVSRTAIQRLESGNAPLQIDTLLKVAETLNMTLAIRSPITHVYEKEMKANVDSDETCL